MVDNSTLNETLPHVLVSVNPDCLGDDEYTVNVTFGTQPKNTMNCTLQQPSDTKDKIKVSSGKVRFVVPGDIKPEGDEEYCYQAMLSDVQRMDGMQCIHVHVCTCTTIVQC